MAKKVFVGGIPYTLTEAQLEEKFSEAGKVVSARIITDRFTGKSRGFAFVEYEKDEDADKAIETLNDVELEGRKIVVNVAQERADRGPGDGGDRGSFRRDS